MWDFVLVSLFLADSSNPPRRIMDYARLVYGPNNPEEKQQNYACMSSGTFYFHKYKGSRRKGTQVVPIGPILLDILKKWELICCRRRVLHPLRGEARDLSSSVLSKHLQRIFTERLGKKISCCLIRSIYITYFYGARIRGRDCIDVAEKMGHSVRTALNVYHRP